jgi:two-component system, cell cycle sensor histidine kinase PleC
VRVRCDEVRLKQVFINVLSNAVKFTPSGGQVDASVALEPDGAICVTIRDTGIGMTPAEIEAAFEQFQQIDNSLTKRFEGTGLGLPLAKQLIELHGGTIFMSSEPSVGTEVRLRLPASRVVQVDAGALKTRVSLTVPDFAQGAEPFPAEPAAASGWDASEARPR